MQKIKLNLNFMVILKYVLIGIITTLVGIVIFAILLKFVDVPSSAINYVNNIIKSVSIFIIVLLIRKNNGQNLLVKSIFSGCLYAVLSFIIFSILNGAFNFDLSVLYDIVFALIVSVIAAVMLNLTRKRSV